MLSKAPKESAGAAPAKRQQWSIGIYTGVSPFDLEPAEGIDNPVLCPWDVAGIPSTLVADPFMLRQNEAWWMFFEVLNKETSKGEIGLAVSFNGEQWKYQGIVLDEPFHLSYPYVFEWKRNYYMIPESYQANSVRLYRAVDFPIRWSFEDTILCGRDYVDPSVFQFAGRWWLFAGHGTPPYRADVLRLYYASELSGPWLEHPESPIVDGNAQISRPAGRVIVVGNKVIRFAQDCSKEYGSKVRAFEITDLTTSSYHEREVSENPILTGSGAGWNASGMHHIDPHLMPDGRWLACVDGWTVIEP